MDAGLRIKNDSGIVQIDSTYSNYYLHSKQVVSLETGAGGSPFSSVSVSVPYPGQCLIALRSSVAVSVVAQTDDRVNIAGQRGSVGVSVTVYFFVPANLSPLVGTGEGGLRVFGPNGALVFDNSAKMVKILAYVTSPSAGQEISLGATGTYAAVILNEAYSITYTRLSGGGANNNASWTYTFSEDLVQITSTGCVFSKATLNSGAFLASDNPPPQPLY
ncbi:hypothetical protein ADT27_10170, partial [Xanthomonas oryzae]|uniref:hypothetical protein n=1 Tax=Xanthomonas oryzae TaxID=347 RepID=UPI0006C0D073